MASTVTTAPRLGCPPLRLASRRSQLRTPTSSSRRTVPTSMRAGKGRHSDPELSLLGALFTTTTNKILPVQAAESILREIPAYLPKVNLDASNLEEALMSVPDLETIPYTVLKRCKAYEIRIMEGYTVAEVAMRGKPFDYGASGQAFNQVAGYLFGSNDQSEAMAMTTPVISQPPSSPPSDDNSPMVIRSSSAAGDSGEWTMAFVMPKEGRTGPLPTPKDQAVRLREIPPRAMAVSAFSGLPSNEDIDRRTAALRRALILDPEVKTVGSPTASAEVAQYNPPFTLPFMRRNEVALEVEVVGKQLLGP